MKRPLVSILIPVFNRQDLIGPCIQSALDQTCQDIEVVVIDNASTDGTWEVCQAFAARDPRVRIFQNVENLGPVRNWQRCMEEALGVYGKIIFSDDLIAPEYLAKTLPFLDDDSVGLVFTATRIGEQYDESARIYYQPFDKSGIYHSAVFIERSLQVDESYPVSPGCAIFRLADLRENLRLEIPSEVVHDFPDHGAGPDLLLYLLTANDYPSIAFVNEPLSFFRFHAGSITISDRGKYIPICHQEARNWFRREHYRLNYLVSAIVSTYNSERFIAGCLDDLLGQTIAEALEIIVIDSASPQNEGRIVREYQKRYPNITYIRTPERESVYAAWNRGIKAAHGTYVTNANTDDRHRSDAFELMARALDAAPDAAVVYADQLVTDEPDTPFERCRRVGLFERPDFQREILLTGCHMGSQPMWRRDIHEQVGYYDERFKSASDYEFWCRIALTHSMVHLSLCLGAYYRNPQGVENSNLKLSLQETETINAMYRPLLSALPALETRPGRALLSFLLPISSREDLEFLEEALVGYLSATSAESPAVLRIWLLDRKGEQEAAEIAMRACASLGLDPNMPFAEVEIVAGNGMIEGVRGTLEGSDVLIAPASLDGAFLKLAGEVDLPVLTRPTANAIRSHLDAWQPEAIDIVLLTHNRLGYLAKTVDALYAHTRHPFRLTIVDNASDPEVLSYLDAHRDRFHRVIRNAENRWTRAFTEGIALTRSDPFIVSDPDILVPDMQPCWLSRMLGLMHAHPEMGMLALNLDASNKPAKLPDVYVSEKRPYGPDITLSNVGTVMQTIRRRFFTPPYTTDWQTIEGIRARGGLVGFANHLIGYHLGWDEERDYPEHLVKKFHYFHDNYGTSLYKRYTNDARLLKAMESKPLSDPAEPSEYYSYSRPEVQALIPITAKRILDVGCAGGAISRAIKQRQDCHVTGIEYVPDVAAIARRHLDEVHTGDALTHMAGLKANQFDCIVFADVLEHLVDPKACLTEAKRLLASGGLIVASIPNVRHWSVVKALLEGRWDYQDAGILDRTHLRFFTRQSLIRMFEETGFRVSQLSGTHLTGIDVPPAVVKDLAQAGLDTSSLEQEGKIYQFLVTATPAIQKVTELTSIVMLTWNQLPYTRLCIESIFNHTAEPFELIIVDNGSTDGTVSYLQELASESINVKLVLNTTNRGFAGGCNQGMAIATGQYILLLNNDTVVSPGWLKGLLGALEVDGAGVVGPRTNSIVGPQLVESVPYDPVTLAGFIEFSEKWRNEHRNTCTITNRIIGFCMLIRREVVERIGGLDIAFGKGNFEDDDYNLRIGQLGYKILIAEEVFIHHFGSVTFQGQKIDYREAMKANWQLFRQKWLLEDIPGAMSYRISDALALPFDPLIHTEPLFALHTEAQDLPDRRAFNIVVAEADETLLRRTVRSYLQAFEQDADVALHVLCYRDTQTVEAVVLEELRMLGCDPEAIPDISLLDAPRSPLELPGYLRSADVAIGSLRVLWGARDMGVPATNEPTCDYLQVAHASFDRLDWLAPAAPLAERTPERWLLSDMRAWEEAVSHFLGTIKPNQGASLLVRIAPGQAEAMHQTLAGWLEAKGYDLERIPDILLLPDPVESEISLMRMATHWLDTKQPLSRAIAKSLGLEVIALPGLDPATRTTELAIPQD